MALLDSSLKRLHTCEGSTDTVSDELLCTNYARKVKQRYQKHEAFFRSFGADVPQLASKILSFLEDYESQKRFNKAGYIHGDPVFSNVLLTHDGSVKFLDMRGRLEMYSQHVEMSLMICRRSINLYVATTRSF